MQKSEQVTSLCVPGDSEGDEEETTQDEVSSHTSEEDGGVVKVEKELENAEQPVGGNEVVEHEVTENLNPDPLLGLCQCPLCQLDCGSREQLIAHVYQHTAAVVSAKSYMCPVCGRALSSPGSLGRHLLIHSEDQRSNCAVCGARFTSHATFNRLAGYRILLCWEQIAGCRFCFPKS